MKTTCLINSHNYRDYICQAIDSTLNQTRAFDEIIVIDDGSTDGSLELLESEYGNDDRVVVLGKPQAGQLSCFHRGYEIGTGDIFFFLDADDKYTSKMLSNVMQIYESRLGIDFVAVDFQEFGQPGKSKRMLTKTRDCGISALRCVLDQAWVGNPTSCLSMRSELLRQILPYPSEAEWQTRADDVLVYGSSIAGARKFYLEDRLIRYRIHSSNHFFGRPLDDAIKRLHQSRVDDLIRWYTEKFEYDVHELDYLLGEEFRTISRPTLRELKCYLKMVYRVQIPWRSKLNQTVACVNHFTRAPFISPKRGPMGDLIDRKGYRSSSGVLPAANRKAA